MATTHFGYQTVDEAQKAARVRGVFDSVAQKYDIMNDLMSGGLHRAWKAYTVAVAAVQPGHRVLDIAGVRGICRARSLVPWGPAAWWCTPTSTRPCCGWAETA